MPFQFLAVDEGCSGSRQQSSTQNQCQFGKRGFSALYQRQGGTVSFLVLATFVETSVPLHTMCFPLGLDLCPKGPTSSKPSWCSGGSRVMDLKCCVALFSFPYPHSTACSCSPVFKDTLPLNAHGCYWVHSSVTCPGIRKQP